MKPIIHRRAFDRLVRALDRASVDDGATDDDVARAKRVLLSPFRHIEAFALEAEGVMAGHSGSFERMRVMLATHAAPLLAVKAGRASNRSAPENFVEDRLRHEELGAEEPASARLCGAGVLDMGGLVIVALAAGIVGKRYGHARMYTEAVFERAAATLPAEMLARAVGRGLQPSELATVIAGLSSPYENELLISAQLRLFMDDCSRARRQVLKRITYLVGEQVDSLPAAAFSDIIRRVTRHDDYLVLKLHRKDEGGETPGWGSLPHASNLFKALEKGSAKVVFAADSGPPTLATPRSADLDTMTVEVALEPGSRAGWVGIATQKTLKEAAAARRSIRESWEDENENATFGDWEVPVDLIAPAAAGAAVPLSPPPRAADASWGLSMRDIQLGDGSGGGLLRGQAAAVGVDLHPGGLASRIELRSAGETIELELNQDRSRASGVLPAAHVRYGAVVDVFAYAENRDEPDDLQRITLDVRAPQPDRKPHAKGGAKVVVLRPAVLGADDDGALTYARVEAAEVAEILAGMERRSQQRYEEIPLPWIADADLSVRGSVQDPDGPAASRIRQRVGRLAATSQGFEAASWIVLLPARAAGGEFVRASPAEAAAQIVLATPGALMDHGLPQPRLGKPSGRRLRLIGRIEADDVVVTEPIRVQRRASGSGAEHATPIVAVGLDRDGRERIARRVHTASPTRRGGFVSLLPVDAEIASVEFQYRPDTLAVQFRGGPEAVEVDLRSLGGPTGARRLRFGGGEDRAPWNRRPTGPLPRARRRSGKPTVRDLVADASGATWGYDHADGSAVRFEVELGTEAGTWVRVAAVEPFCLRANLELSRFGGRSTFDRIRVVGSDGWNAATDLQEHVEAPVRRSRIRAAASRVFWADLDDEGGAAWELYGPNVDDGAALAAAAGVEPIRRFEGPIVEIGNEFSGGVLVLRGPNGTTDRVVVP